MGWGTWSPCEVAGVWGAPVAGNDLLREGDVEGAVSRYSDAIDAAPTGVQAHVLYANRAAAYTRLGKHEQALADALCVMGGVGAVCVGVGVCAAEGGGSSGAAWCRQTDRAVSMWVCFCAVCCECRGGRGAMRVWLCAVVAASPCP